MGFVEQGSIGGVQRARCHEWSLTAARPIIPVQCGHSYAAATTRFPIQIAKRKRSQEAYYSFGNLIRQGSVKGLGLLQAKASMF